MDAEVTLFSKPEELIAWADTFDILLNPSIEDAAILLNYMEGHDYAIGIDSDGKMYRQDVAEENGEIEPYPIDDVIDIVCEWNYELILDASFLKETLCLLHIIAFLSSKNLYIHRINLSTLFFFFLYSASISNPT